MSKKARKRQTFRFKPGFTIGGVAAESDPLLEECFLPTDCYESINEMKDPRCAMIGRSGTGKTAILEELKRNHGENVVVIDPEALAFQFLGKSDMMRALTGSGVNLDYFYKLLWRHVLVIEILKNIFPEESRRYGKIYQLFEAIRRKIKSNPARESAIKYLDEWDASVLQSPQERVREIHDSLARKLRTKLGFNTGWMQLFGLAAEVEGEFASTKEVKERIRIVNEVINQIQIQDLNTIRDYMGSVILEGRQKPCYVLVDDLDRFVVDDYLVFELVRGLILEIYDLKKVKNLKIVYALRNNIVNKIESEFRTRSYQKEKLEDQRYYLSWTRTELVEIINKRLEKISRDNDFINTPSLNDILPKRTSNETSGLNFIFERTLDRPRDVIDYINKAGELCLGKERISMVAIKRSEDRYSEGRLSALFDEWRENYPGLEILTKLIRGYPPRFALSLWSESDILEALMDRKIPEKGWIADICKEYEKDFEKSPGLALANCRRKVLKLFFEVGLVGVKSSEGGIIKYCYTAAPLISEVEIEEDVQVVIHPSFHKALGVQSWESP